MSEPEPATEKLDLHGGLEALTAAIGAASAADSALPIGSRFGSYRLLGVLGSGGMGRVYLAEQTAPVHRRVALKLLPCTQRGDDTLMRLTLESQALAQMQHPCIAQFFDAGLSPQGYPWLAMEHVDGQPLHLYCKNHPLSLEQRLELFIELCLGVAHAHQKGVIHCDLKPSNVLLTQVDGRTVPKIIDFGIARVSRRDGLQDSEGTPRYMSPEQAGAWPAPVDTRTDVHGLGLILHELLCGRPQRDPQLFDAASLRSLPGLIRETARPLPSTQHDDARAARRLRGELDSIVAKATELDPEQRYASAAALAEDLRRYRKRQPVMAMPSSRRYQLRCLLRRHATASVTAVVFALVVSALLWRLASQLEQTRIERDSAREVASVLVDTFEAADPALYPGGSMSVRELLARSARRIADQSMAAEVRLRVLQSLGTVQHRLELYDDALHTLGRARELAARRSQSHSADLELLYARATMDSEAFETAEALITELVQRGKQGDPVLHADALLLAAENQIYMNRYPQARQALDQAWHLPELTGQQQLLQRWYQLSGGLYSHVADFDLAFADLQQALVLAESLWGEHDLRSLTVLNDLAVAQSRAGLLERAEVSYRRIIAASDAIWGEPSADTARTMSNLASLLERSGRLAEAQALYRQTVEVFRQRTGPRSLDTGIALNGLAVTLQNSGKPDAALQPYREAVGILREVLGDRHYVLGIALHNQGRCLTMLGQMEAAAISLDESGAILRETLGESHPRYLIWATTQAQWLAAHDRDEEALTLLAAAEPGLLAAQGAQAGEAVRARELRLALLQKQHRCDELQLLLAERGMAPESAHACNSQSL